MDKHLPFVQFLRQVVCQRGRLTHAICLATDWPHLVCGWSKGDRFLSLKRVYFMLD